MAKTSDAPADSLENDKLNASEKINLQHIMALRDAFEAMDTDKGGALDIDEVRIFLIHLV